MRRGNKRHDTQVDHPEALSAVDAELIIDYAALVPREHRARASRMMDGREVLLQPESNLLVGLHGRSGVDLTA